jgi:oxygen-independent coproporphyrinogen-3 oxidase
MAGIYIHIPFCKQACHYCDFHFSTSLNALEPLIAAIKAEIALQSDYLKGQEISSIYFGGGTPSLLSTSHIAGIINLIEHKFSVAKNVEITLEVNPDDITTKAKLKAYQAIGVNRLSIGIQSFSDSHLKFFNRAHEAGQGIQAVKLAQSAGINNITIDLIYGFLGLSNAEWEANLMQAFELGVPHISAYSLTIEPKTAFGTWAKRDNTVYVTDDYAANHFQILQKAMGNAGFEAYETSNFAKPGFRSRHNSSYWQGAHYLGVGPSAHSFNGVSRQYNVKNNALYIKAIEMGEIPAEIEVLTLENQINERLMTQLRLIEGLNLAKLQADLDYDLLKHQGKAVDKLIQQGLAEITHNHLVLTAQGKLMADGIASELFVG